MKSAVRQQTGSEHPQQRHARFSFFTARQIVGQEEGVQSLVDMFQVFCAGLNSPGRPVGNLLFSGADRLGKNPHCGGGRGKSYLATRAR